MCCVAREKDIWLDRLLPSGLCVVYQQVIVRRERGELRQAGMRTIVISKKIFI